MGKTCTRLGLGTASTRRAWFIHRHLLPSLFGDVVMKDSNDNATMDWVDEANADNQAAPTGFYITENAAIDKALNRIVNITLQDLLGD